MNVLIWRIILVSLVLFMGSQKMDRVRDLLYLRNVLVAPSMPSSLVEFFPSFTPIVPDNDEWHPELIEDEQTGPLVQRSGSVRLVSTVILVFKNPEGASFVGRDTKEHVSSLFMMENHPSLEKKWLDELPVIHHD